MLCKLRIQERKNRVLKPDFNALRAEREKEALQRRLRENQRVIDQFRAKHQKKKKKDEVV